MSPSGSVRDNNELSLESLSRVDVGSVGLPLGAETESRVDTCLREIANLEKAALPSTVDDDVAQLEDLLRSRRDNIGSSNNSVLVGRKLQIIQFRLEKKRLLQEICG